MTEIMMTNFLEEPSIATNFDENFDAQTEFRTLKLGDGYSDPRAPTIDYSYQKSPELCILPNCINFKMVFRGAIQPFCSPSCAKRYEAMNVASQQSQLHVSHDLTTHFSKCLQNFGK